MDVILKKVLVDENLHKSTAKQQVVTKIIRSFAKLPIEVVTCKRLFEMSWLFAVTTEKALERDLALKIFQAWVPYNRGTLAEWIEEDAKLKTLLSEANRDKVCLFQLMLFTLEHLDHESTSYQSAVEVMTDSLDLLLQEPLSLPAMVAATSLMERLPQCLKTQQQSILFLRNLALLDMQSALEEGAKEKVNSICLYLKSILIHDSEDPDGLKHAFLTTLHSHLTDNNKQCSYVTAAVIEILHFNQTEIDENCERVVAVTPDDIDLIRILNRMISWLLWPKTTKSAIWITSIFNSCERNKRLDVLKMVFETAISNVLTCLLPPDTRDGAALIFGYIMKHSTYSPGIKQKILDIGPKVISQLEVQDTMESKLVLTTVLKCIISELAKTRESKNSEQAGGSLGTQFLWSFSPEQSPERKMSDTLLNDNPLKLTGLENLGNTCYINSVIQALNMTYSFRKKILGYANGNQRNVIVSLQETLAFLLLTKRPSYSPDDFVKVSRPNWFRAGEQQDSQEYLSYLFDQLEETAASSCIQDTFGGIVETCNTCCSCNRTSIVKDTFTSLLLPFPASAEEIKSPTITLEDMIHSYLKPERLDGGNMYKCDFCDELRPAERRIRIKETSKHLVITLLRFEYSLQTRRKIKTPVIFPKVLDFPKENSDGIRSTEKYFLYAVIVHSGVTTNKGHYYTYARSSVSLTERESCEDKWFLFNDHKVSEASFDLVQKVNSVNLKESAYMLFYCSETEDCVSESVSNLVNIRLKRTVLLDNERYMKDQSKAKNTPSTKKNMFHKDSKDDDDKPPPPGGGICGLDGGFGGFNSPSRVVF